jgi:DNA-binding transcriptional regulator YiaG
MTDVSVATLRNREQRRRTADGQAQAFLRVAALSRAPLARRCTTYPGREWLEGIR